MKAFAQILLAAAVAGGVAAPALAAQDDLQAQGVINDVIDRLIGNRYKVSERDAIRACGWAAVRRAEDRYRGDFNTLPVAYPGRHRGHVRVAAITDVQRRSSGVRVRGLLDTARWGYRGGRNGSDLSFRCDTNRRGRVQDVRIDRNPWYRPR
jgi:hypothetical protein